GQPDRRGAGERDAGGGRPERRADRLQRPCACDAERDGGRPEQPDPGSVPDRESGQGFDQQPRAGASGHELIGSRQAEMEKARFGGPFSWVFPGGEGIAKNLSFRPQGEIPVPQELSFRPKGEICLSPASGTRFLPLVEMTGCYWVPESPCGRNDRLFPGGGRRRPWGLGYRA